MRIFFLAIKFMLYTGIDYPFGNTEHKNAVMVVGILLICIFYEMIPSFNYISIRLLGLSVVGTLLLYQWKLKEQDQQENNSYDILRV